MASLKDICFHLQECLEKVEEKVKIDKNDSENKITSNEMGEIKVALEKAKDYHYSEIINLLRDILDKVKIIKFHQDKISMLSDDRNLSQEDAKRYSYVQRQINNFSRSEGNLSTIGASARRERRRVASDLSMEFLDTWEKFLDSNKGEAEILQKEEKQIMTETVPKRPTKNSLRKKKKFVSSTLDGFLDRDFRCSSLDSIVEEYSDIETNLEKGLSTPNLYNYNNFIESRPWLIKNVRDSEDVKVIDATKDVNSKNEVVEGENTEINLSSQQAEAEDSEFKPRVVNVIYKDKPS